MTAQPLHTKTFPVSWDELHRHARALAWRLLELGAVAGHRRDHPRRAGAGGDRRARARHPPRRYGVHRELRRPHAGRAADPEARRRRRRGLAHHRRSRRYRRHRARGARDAAQGAFRHRLCQARRAAAGRYLRHRGEPGHLDPLPLGHRAAIRAAHRRPRRSEGKGASLLGGAGLACARRRRTALPRHDMVESADPLAAAIGRDILRARRQRGRCRDRHGRVAHHRRAAIGGHRRRRLPGALVGASDHSVAALDGRETAPAAAKPDPLPRRDGKPLPFFNAMVGGRSVGVPGLLRMLDAGAPALSASCRGRQLFAPSIKLAEDGYPLSPRVSALLAPRPLSAQDAGARALLRRATATAKPAGAIIEQSRRSPTTLRVDRARRRRCVLSRRRSPTTSPAAVAGDNPPGDLSRSRSRRLQREGARGALRALSRLARVRHGTASSGEADGAGNPAAARAVRSGASCRRCRRVDLFAEASRLAYADRARYLADPDFVAAPVAGLLDPAYLAARAKLIDPAHAAPGPVAPGEPARQARRSLGRRAARRNFPRPRNISVIDRDGNAVAMTATIEANFGSHVHGARIPAQQRADRFLVHPRERTAGRSPTGSSRASGRLSAMSPTLVFAPDGKLALVVGSAGGPADHHRRRQDHRRRHRLEEESGRRHRAAQCRQPQRRDRDRDFAGADALAAALKARGHDVRVWKRESGIGGILVTPDGSKAPPIRGARARRSAIDGDVTDDPATRPTVTLEAGRHKRAATGHPWVYSNEVRMDAAAKALPPGSLVTLVRRTGARSASPPSTRMRSSRRASSTATPRRAIDRDFFAERIGRALKPAPAAL